MTDDALEPKLASARRVAPSWTLSRQQQVIWAVAGRLQSRRRGLRKLALGAAVFTLALSAWGLHGWGQRSVAHLTGAPAESAAVAAIRQAFTLVFVVINSLQKKFVCNRFAPAFGHSRR